MASSSTSESDSLLGNTAGEPEQAACMLATEERMRYRTEAAEC